MEEAFFRIAVDQRPYIRSAPFSPHKRPGFQEEEPVALTRAYHQYNQPASSGLTVDTCFGAASVSSVALLCQPRAAGWHTTRSKVRLTDPKQFRDFPCIFARSTVQFFPHYLKTKTLFDVLPKDLLRQLIDCIILPASLREPVLQPSHIKTPSPASACNCIVREIWTCGPLSTL